MGWKGESCGLLKASCAVFWFGSWVLECGFIGEIVIHTWMHKNKWGIHWGL